MFKRHVVASMLVLSSFALPAIAFSHSIELRTIADATRGIKKLIPMGDPGASSPGDILAFDQPLLDEKEVPIGKNSGFCVTVKPNDHFQCQWTLALSNGSITVGGQEAQKGKSILPVIGTTGIYENYTGVMISEPLGNDKYSQVVKLQERSK